jgi:hypothetical protein
MRTNRTMKKFQVALAVYLLLFGGGNVATSRRLSDPDYPPIGEYQPHTRVTDYVSFDNSLKRLNLVIAN